MIAICSMVRKPFNFDWWLDYHLSLGIDYIFLRVEDTPELSEILKNYTDKVIVEYDNSVDKRDNYWTQMDRQKLFIDSIKPNLSNLGVDWLIHIDSDELICCNGDLKNIFANIPVEYQTVRFANYEAVYDSDDLENPFLQTSRFRYDEFRISYKNGKSAGRVNEYLRVKSPHKFFGKRLYFPEVKIVILHFESAKFDSWYTKFSQEIDEEKYLKIPFEFYKKSIDIVRLGDKELARKYYNEMKVDVTDPTIKLYWTPNLENKNIRWSK